METSFTQLWLKQVYQKLMDRKQTKSAFRGYLILKNPPRIG